MCSKKVKKILCALLVVVLLACTQLTAFAATNMLIKTSDFEGCSTLEDIGDPTWYWWIYPYDPECASISDSNAYEGSKSLKIESVDNMGGFGFKNIDGLQPNTEYIFSFWAKVESTDAGLKPVIGAKKTGDKDVTAPIKVGRGYQKYTLNFKTGEEPHATEVYYWHDGGEGIAYTDNWTLYKASDVKSTSTSTSTSTSASASKENPKTGDAGMLVYGLLAGAAAVSGVVMYARKKQVNK